MSIEKIMYRAHAKVTGGRDGRAVSSDNVLDLKLTVPREMGGAGEVGTNPEQLFAAGYSACFLGALKYVAGREKVTLPGPFGWWLQFVWGIALVLIAMAAWDLWRRRRIHPAVMVTARSQASITGTRSPAYLAAAIPARPSAAGPAGRTSPRAHPARRDRSQADEEPRAR